MPTDVTPKTTKKDIDSYYLEKIANHLANISELQYIICTAPKRIVYINMELQEMFKMIIPFLKQNKFDDMVDKQWAYQKKLIETKPIQTVPTPNPDGNPLFKAKITEHWPKYKMLCDYRQVHMYECLATLGILGRLKPETRRLR